MMHIGTPSNMRYSTVRINDLVRLHENSYGRLSAELCCARVTLGGLEHQKLNNASHRVNRRESARGLMQDARENSDVWK